MKVTSIVLCLVLLSVAICSARPRAQSNVLNSPPPSERPPFPGYYPEIEEPDSPDTPDKPDGPETPDSPDGPETPDKPEKPEAPEPHDPFDTK